MSGAPSFIAFADASPAERARFAAIYEEALPEAERKAAADIAALGARPDYAFELLRLDGEVAGFLIVYLSQAHPMSLLEYAAVDASRRNAGLGGLLLQRALGLSDGRAMLVEVDSDREAQAADRALRSRRKRFYLRHGCRQVPGVHYVMPTVGKDAPPPMDLLVATPDEAVSPATLRLWLSDIYANVYARPQDDPAIDRMIAPLPDPIAL